jgi:adenylate cyclase
VRQEAGEGFEFRFVGNVVPRGAREPVPIYALVGLCEEASKTAEATASGLRPDIAGARAD